MVIAAALLCPPLDCRVIKGDSTLLRVRDRKEIEIETYRQTLEVRWASLWVTSITSVS